MDTQVHFHTKQLTRFYNAGATKFGQTRHKFQHNFELDHLCRAINEYASAQDQTLPLHILELGCGDGRFYTYLQEHCSHDIVYTGVDISSSMIELANAKHPDIERVIDDMNVYLQTLEPLSYDIIVSVAAYQHLPTDSHRHHYFQMVYQALKYQGLSLMTNRSWSYWMLRKHWKPCLKALLTSVCSLSYCNKRNDLQIPFVIDQISYDRYYHIFTLRELRTLHRMHGFIITEASYLDNKGFLTNDRSHAKNTFLIASKDVVLHT